ncbi:MAG: hypothetical protein ACTHL8_14585 [Burkholderiaceae bacterium]
MKDKIRCATLAVALLAAVGVSHAGTYAGTFRPYWYQGVLYIEETSVTKGGLPACATRNILRLTVDQTSTEGKEQYAMLLAAWYTGRTLSITGLGQCTPEGDELILEISPQ